MSSWKDELHTAAALGGWPEANVGQAEMAIASLPDSTDWNPPGDFWIGASGVVSAQLGALGRALADTWAARGVDRGRNWTDTAGDWWDGAVNGGSKTLEMAGTVLTNATVPGLVLVKDTAQAGAVIATKGAEAVDKSIDIVNKTNNTARMIGIPLVILLGAAYFGFGRK